MATWKKVLTRDSAVNSTDGLLLSAGTIDATNKTITLSDGTNTDSVTIAVSTGLSIAQSGDTITLTNTVTNTDTQLTQEEVQDYAWNVLGGTQTGITVTYQDATNDVDFVVADQTLTSATSNTNNILLTLSNPTTDDTVEIVAGDNITLTNNTAGQFTIAASTLTEEQVEDYVGGMLVGTQTGITVTYQDTTNDIDFVVADQTLTTAQSNSNITITLSNPTTDDSITVTAGNNITLTDDSNGGFTIAASATASNVTVTDSDTDELAHLVFTTATSGSASLKVDSSTLSYNASSDTLFVNNLTVSGTQTTVQTATLIVEDKNIILGNPDSAYASDAAAVAGASGGGITIVSDADGGEGDYAGISWDNGTPLTQWQLRDAASTAETAGKFPIAVMDFGTAASTAPAGTNNAAGIGSFHMNSTDGKLYVRVA